MTARSSILSYGYTFFVVSHLQSSNFKREHSLLHSTPLINMYTQSSRVWQTSRDRHGEELTQRQATVSGFPRLHDRVSSLSHAALNDSRRGSSLQAHAHSVRIQHLCSESILQQPQQWSGKQANEQKDSLTGQFCTCFA